jgi:hypothetical protein
MSTGAADVALASGDVVYGIEGRSKTRVGIGTVFASGDGCHVVVQGGRFRSKPFEVTSSWQNFERWSVSMLLGPLEPPSVNSVAAVVYVWHQDEVRHSIGLTSRLGPVSELTKVAKLYLPAEMIQWS